MKELLYVPSPKQRTSLERVRGKDSTEIARSFRIHFLPSFSTVSNSSGKLNKLGDGIIKGLSFTIGVEGKGDMTIVLHCICRTAQTVSFMHSTRYCCDRAEVWFQACKYLAGMDRKDQHYRLPFNSSRVSDVPIYLSLANIHRV